MISKRYFLECDWCGEYRFGDTLKYLSEYYCLYRFKSVNPLADELWLNGKWQKFAPKYLGFCCPECAEEYFKDTPEDKRFYKLVGKKK